MWLRNSWQLPQCSLLSARYTHGSPPVPSTSSPHQGAEQRWFHEGRDPIFAATMQRSLRIPRICALLCKRDATIQDEDTEF